MLVYLGLWVSIIRRKEVSTIRNICMYIILLILKKSTKIGKDHNIIKLSFPS